MSYTDLCIVAIDKQWRTFCTEYALPKALGLPVIRSTNRRYRAYVGDRKCINRCRENTEDSPPVANQCPIFYTIIILKSALLSTWSGNNAGPSPHFAGFHLACRYLPHQHLRNPNEVDVHWGRSAKPKNRRICESKIARRRYH